MCSAFHRIGGAVSALFTGILLTTGLVQAAPANDHFADAELLDPAMPMVVGSNMGATKEAGEPVHAFFGGGKSVWWIYDATQNGFLTVSTLQSVTVEQFELDTVLAIYTGSAVNELTEVAWNDDDPDSGAYGSKVIFPVQAGTRYYIAVDGWNYMEGADEGYVVLEYSFSLTLPTNEAPDWMLPSVDGTMVNSTNFSGKLTLVNFWATWCGPCLDEIPDLVQLHNDYERFGFSVIGISIDDAISAEPPTALVADFVNNFGMNYPVVMTRPAWFEVENEFGDLSAIPTTFLVDRKGNIVRKVVGSQNHAFFAEMVKPFLFDNIALSVRREGTDTVIEWPSLAGGATVQLQTAGTLGATWTGLNAEVTDDGVTGSVRISGGPGGFYRLNITP